MGLTTTPSGGGVTGSGSMTGGGVLATGGFTLTVPGTGTAALLGVANAFTAAQTLTLGTNSPTAAAAISLINSTAATAGVQSASPFLCWTAQGWKTNATAGSQQVDFKAFLLPVQGTANPSATLQFQAAINGGAFANVLTLNNETGATIASTVGSGVVLALTSTYGTTTIVRSGAALSFNTALVTSGSYLELNSSGGNVVQLFTRATNYLGLGLASASPAASTFGGTEGSGTNITGGILNIGTRGTGTGTGGVINFQTHAAGASSSTLGTLATVMQITSPTLVTLSSGVALRLGNAATTGLTPGFEADLTNATIVLEDSTGQAYRIPCII